MAVIAIGWETGAVGMDLYSGTAWRHVERVFRWLKSCPSKVKHLQTVSPTPEEKNFYGCWLHLKSIGSSFLELWGFFVKPKFLSSGL